MLRDMGIVIIRKLGNLGQSSLKGFPVTPKYFRGHASRCPSGYAITISMPFILQILWVVIHVPFSGEHLRAVGFYFCE